MSKFIDITGQIFGRLVVLRMAEERSTEGKARCVCQCSCGNIVTVDSQHLRRGSTRSCGCLRLETNKGPRPIHGMHKSPEYKAWAAMKSRCTNPKTVSYHRYGGRGISYDPRWGKFENFFSAMGPRPSPQHTLERVDNSKGYGPGFCVWATRKEQSRNTSTNHLLTYNEITQPLAAWAEEFGIQYDTLHGRIERNWEPSQAFTKPVGQRLSKVKITLNGKTRSLKIWCRELGISLNTMQARIRLGWPIERALTEPVGQSHGKRSEKKIHFNLQ